VHDLKESIVGVSPAMVSLREYLPKLARSNTTVLITGATGTGKDRVAEAIHGLGPRSHRPFVALNCAAMPDGLVESELFGHAKGAFTGAVDASKGLISRADGGTLFLDEIGEMSPFAQVKLLRVIETREVMPVGAEKSLSVSVRIIAATNKRLESLVENGRFRADLFFRLNVARLDLPPLNQRKEDIPLLLENVIQEFNRREHASVLPPGGELLECLMAHDWPGNIRELRNLVEAIFIDPPVGTITFEDLPPLFREIFGKYRPSGTKERDLLLATLRKTNWNKSKTAKQLNWSRMTLYRKMARYQIG
jgi:two-component system response regulator HydG